MKRFGLRPLMPILLMLLMACNPSTEPIKSFSLSIDPANLSLGQGASETVNVSLERTNFTDPIDVSLQGTGGTALPAGISATFTANATGGSFNISVANTTVIKEHALEVKAVGGSITKTTALLLNVTAPAASDLTLELNPSDLTVTQGQAGTVAVILTRTNLTGDAVISLQGTGGAALPTGISSAGTTIAATTGSLAINVAANVGVNTYSLEIKAVTGSITKMKPLTLKVVAPAASDFSVTSLVPDKLSLEQGKSGSTVINLTRNNLTADIVLSLQSQGGAGLPAGITAANLTVTGNSGTLSISTTAALAPKDYALEVKAVSGNLTKTTPFTLTVTAIAVPSDFTLSSNPSSLGLEQGKSGTTAITIVRTNLSATIDVVLQGVGGATLPTGISSSFAASSTGGTLTVNATASAALQNDTSLEIKAASGTIVKTTPFKLTITPKPDFTLTTGTPTLTIEPTFSKPLGVTLTGNNVSTSVTVSLQGTNGAPLPTGITAAPVNITGNNADVLNIVVTTNNASTQDFSLEIKAVGGGVTKTTAVTLTILAAPFAVNKATQTIIGWKPGELGDLLSATSDNPTIANYTTPIDGTGLVSYELPIPTVLSAPSTLLATYCPNTTNLTFSSSTVKGSERQFGAPNSAKTTYGSLIISNDTITSPPKLGLEQAFVVYLDGDVNVTGTCQNSSGIIVNVNVNAQLKQGWNILVGKVITVSSAAIPVVGVEVTSRTTVPARYAWRYYPR